VEDAETRLEDAVGGLRADLRARYPVVIDTTQWSWMDGAIHVRGAVLVSAQALGYQKGISSALELNLHDIPRPTVLTDRSTHYTAVSWAQLQGTGSLDLFGSPDGDDLQTQWKLSGWVRLFLNEPTRARVLLQLPDGTVGWSVREHLRPDTPAADPWSGVDHAPTNVVANSNVSLDVAAVLARKRVGSPYLWGGNTTEAADCSGFVQTVVHDASGVLLPKNTRDQMKCGVRVARDSIEPGDLLFVRGRKKNVMHVGLVLGAEGNDLSVIHSCLSRERVLEETLDVFLERYRFTAARRVLRWRAP